MKKHKNQNTDHLIGISGNIEYISITTTLHGERVGLQYPFPASDDNKYGLCILGQNLSIGEDNPNFDLTQFPPTNVKIRNLNDEKDPSKYLKS